MTNFQPIFLIGAARSGTKLLRDIIASHPTIRRVPYDINFIWRFGNESLPHDELAPENLNPELIRRIREKIMGYARNAPFLIEKTVSNSLRVPFVSTIFPEARYIFLFRDAYDVVESSYRQWAAPPDWRYLVQKACSFPFLDAPAYALKYAVNIIKKRGMTTQRAATWGPKYAGIHQDIASCTLLEVCAIQWIRSVNHSFAVFQSMDPSQAMAVQYEGFVNSPETCLTKIAIFLGVDSFPYHEEIYLRQVSRNNIGKGRRQLSPAQQQQISAVIQDRLDPAISSQLFTHDFSSQILPVNKKEPARSV